MELLDPLEAAMMLGEAVSSPLHMAAVLVLRLPDDAGPGYVDDLYQQLLVSPLGLDRRLRRYPHRGLDTGGLWVWRELDAVDLAEHCGRLELPAGSDGEALWRLVGRLHAERLDRSRPMWECWLIDGLDDGHFAAYMKVHHTVMDGVAGVELITNLLSADPNARSLSPFDSSEHPGLTEAATSSMPTRIPNLFSLTRALICGNLSDLVKGLTTDTTVAPLSAPHTRFNGRLHDRCSAAAVDLAKSRIRAVQSAANVTANDVVITVISGVLRDWLLDHDELPKQSLVAICPISARDPGRPAGDEGGNQFGAWLCPLGTDLNDPRSRLDLIHRSMSEGKRRVASRGPGTSMLLLASSIGPTVLQPLVPLAPQLRTGYNLPISGVPGPRSQMYWNGAHVEGIYPVSTVYDGQALNVTTCSYADQMCFGYAAGGDAMPDIASAPERTEQAMAELETAVGAVTRTADG